MTHPTRPRRTASAALLAVLVIALFAPAGAQADKKKKKKDPEQAIVAGTVIDLADEVVAGVAVTLSSPESGFSASATTDKKGEFSIEVPTGGDYLLRLAKEGYAPREEQMMLTAGEQHTVRVQLLDASAGKRNEAVKAYNAGAEAYEAKDYATAKARFLEAVEADPSLPEPHLVLADIYLIEGDPEAAAAAADAFLALKPGDQKGQMLAYEANLKLGNQARVDELRAALGSSDVAPKLAIQAYNEGAIANQEGDLDTAIEKFKAALGLNPELAEAHAGLGAIYYNQERYAEALEAIEKAVALKPGHVTAQRVRFLIHDALGNREAAEKAMASYVELDRDGAAGLLYQRADLDFRDGYPDLARAGLEKALELKPDLARAYYTLGLIYASTDVARAKEHLKRFIEMAPDDPEVATAREMLGSL